MDQEEIIATLARIDERTEHILNHLKKLNGTVSEHDEAINELQTVQERHKTYFKLIGTAILIIVTIICAVLDKVFLR